MYVLVQLEDTIRIPPHMFAISQKEAITDELNRKLANRVIINTGLCICLSDITKIGKSFLYQSDGATHTLVNFRFVVFRPFIGEVIVGKIRSSSMDGVLVSLGFFADIIIPPHYLQDNSKFDETEQLWFWEYEDNKLFMDIGEKIRFKVKEELFVDTSPSGPTSTSNISGGDNTNTVTDNKRKIPYLIKGTINESGLGLISWWKE
ncbi:DNA-directed RNA polymerase III subunit RPC8-like [Oppia nitens]|uniref:DNA-directed RNA polymerase III subunit RPC8-like n=1 Tax=Oppia nitens TaxID=1686743 RepID=UPI0023DC75F0|nr:DNA-directed RNA polymerase III subunit RPC8-like [Oppia nitens]